jgi:hypothetical protein
MAKDLKYLTAERMGWVDDSYLLGPIMKNIGSLNCIPGRPLGRLHRPCGSSRPSPWRGRAGARPQQSGEEKPQGLLSGPCPDGGTIRIAIFLLSLTPLPVTLYYPCLWEEAIPYGNGRSTGSAENEFLSYDERIFLELL